MPPILALLLTRMGSQKEYVRIVQAGIQSRRSIVPHLIRCPASEKADEKASTTEQRLTLIEGCFNGMQRQSDGFNAMGNIEQLLHRLVRATEGRAALFHRPSWNTRGTHLLDNIRKFHSARMSTEYL